MATNINAEFVIAGDTFDLNVITEKLKIEPHESWVKGEIVPGKPIRRRDTCWSIETGYEESLYVSEQLSKILNVLRDKKLVLCELQQLYKIKCFFQVVINIEDDEKPVVTLNSEVIEFANDIKAEVDIVFYIY